MLLPSTGVRPALFFAAVLFFYLPDPLFAQDTRRFKAGIVFGVTASQIDGDESAGYHKVGLQGGLRGIVLLKEKQDLSVELLFTQRGNRNQPDYFPLFKTTLNYVEIPVQWHYRDWLAGADSDKPDFYRIHFNTGLSYGRLMGYQNDSEGGSGITAALPHLNKHSICFLIGASFFATHNLGFTVRYHRAINRLYSPGKPGTNYANSLNEHFLALRAEWVF